MTEEKLKCAVRLYERRTALQKAYDMFNAKSYSLGFARKDSGGSFTFDAYENGKIKEILDAAHLAVLTKITAEIAEIEREINEL